MLRLGRLDDAEDVAAFSVRERGRSSRMPSYIGVALLVLLAGDLLIHLLQA